MPGTAVDPHYEAWRDRLSAELEALEGTVIIFGHSLGGSVALKYCAESGLRREGGRAWSSRRRPVWGTERWEREWALPESWPGEGRAAAADPSLPQPR